MYAGKKKSWKRIVLKDLIAFIESQHGGGETSLMDISEATGISTRNISAMFNKDDMRLSRAEAIAGQYGYRLKLYFPLKEYPHISGHHAIRNKYPNAGNLQGLIQYMDDSNISINYLSMKTGLNRRLIDRAFHSGDIFLSTLHKIMVNLKAEALWIFEPMNTQ